LGIGSLKKPLYIFSSGELRRKGNTLVLIKGEREKKFVPITSVSEIYVFGELTINKKLLEFISSNEVIVHFFNYYGFYVGSYYPRAHYNSGYMAIKQAEHYLDGSKRIKLARKFVEGAVKNMQRVMQYYASRGCDTKQTLEKLKDFEAKIINTDSIEELMGIEGNAKQSYYKAFNKIIRDENFVFTCRTKRPPRSRLDCLISFMNSLLYVSVLREIYMTHLDPRIGFLHESNFRSFSLNLDVSEVFKPIVVDRTIFAMVNRHMLEDHHFVKELGGILLSEKGRKLVTREFERKMETTVANPKNRKKASYRRLIRIELYKLEKHLMGESEYAPFVSKW